MNNIKVFSTTLDYNNANKLNPSLSFIEDSTDVKYTINDDYPNRYLTFGALESGTFTLTIPDTVNSTYMTSISYSIDNGKSWTKTNITSSSQTITTPTIQQGKTVLWKGIGTQLTSTSGGLNNCNFSSSGKFIVYGNIMSLLYGDDFYNKTTFPTRASGTTSYQFYKLFISSKIVNAKNLILPVTTLFSNCYSNMFNGCTSLITAPELPATTLASSCYLNMFQGCTSLTTAPELPATTLAGSCYSNMFTGCTALTTAPALPATTLANNCYFCMFNGCTSLTTAPVLPATTLAQYCYYYMFSNCTSLTTAPALPATTLASNCYQRMFRDCILLTIAPTLPATTLASYCYDSMFYGCTSLTIAPTLPATTLATNCYSAMFYGCTSLTTVPALPATTLTKNCYQRMFNSCTSLINVPVLPATTLAEGCYSGMFANCKSLKSVPSNMLPATTMYTDCYYAMFMNCSSLKDAPDLPGTTLADYCYQNMFYQCYALEKAPDLLVHILDKQGCYKEMLAFCWSLVYVKMLATEYSGTECLYGFIFGGNNTIILTIHTDADFDYDETNPYATNISSSGLVNNSQRYGLNSVGYITVIRVTE